MMFPKNSSGSKFWMDSKVFRAYHLRQIVIATINYLLSSRMWRMDQLYRLQSTVWKSFQNTLQILRNRYRYQSIGVGHLFYRIMFRRVKFFEEIFRDLKKFEFDYLKSQVGNPRKGF